MSPVIDIGALSFSYGSMPTLFGIDLEVDEGEFLGIVGPNAGGAYHHPAGGRCLRDIGDLQTSPRPSPRPIGRCAAWVPGSAS